MQELKSKALLDFSKTIAAGLLESKAYPWEVLPLLGGFIRDIAGVLPAQRYDNPKEGVYIAKSANIAGSAIITGPCIIGEDTEVRPNAYIRGNALVGNNVVVGNSTELKNVILFDAVQVPHYNYVGDSILGYKAHMGAGSITSNVKSDRTLVKVKIRQNSIPTGLSKLGAVLGDYVEIGCNAVLNPGTVVGKYSQVYPLASVRGYLPPDCIYKNNGTMVIKNK